jgi:hypothetical protein
MIYDSDFFGNAQLIKNDVEESLGEKVMEHIVVFTRYNIMTRITTSAMWLDKFFARIRG